ncbi:MULTISPECIES: hypothetical protein [unclassified Acinetobacter]|uniref:hypothetical protein n=1 Tax=unclassified Acinetobacter TaxID=196816 RepID=UPI0015D12B58|nr:MULTISPECIES: hypothetical protein [unclassified Acinetobacter]
MNAKLEIVAIEQPEIIEAFKVEGGTKALFGRVSENARSVVFDMSVKKDRESLKSFAYSLARIKTTVDNHGKELVSGIKQQAALIDADRKFWRDNMELLQDEIRKPLTDFEQAEKDRVAKHENAILVIKEHLQELETLDASRIVNRIEHLENFDVDYTFEEYEEQAKLAKFETLEVLRKALVTREKYEAEQAELERLRQAEMLRQQQERDAQIAREAAEKATREAEEKARFEAERVQREKAEAEQREARLKAEKEAAELRAVQAAENERKRIEAEQFAQAEGARKAEEARLADVEHRRKINQEAVSALCYCVAGLTEEMAKDVIRAIAKPAVPNVSIKY